MKKRLYNKLKSNSGVSILFALLLFMVVMLVSTTIITVAMTSMKRIDSNKDSRQRNLALESAAMMIRNDLNGLDYWEESNIPVLGSNNTVSSYKMEKASLVGTVFSNEVQTIAEKLQNGGTAPIEGELKIVTNQEEISNVDVSYYMSRSDGTYTSDGSKTVYKLVFTLECGENRMYETFFVSYQSQEKVYQIKVKEGKKYKDGTVKSQVEEFNWTYEGVSSR